MSSERGEYRPFYQSFFHSAAVHALSDRAFRVLVTVKGTLPASGLGIVYLPVLAEQCACSLEQLEEALDELERPTEGEFGWIVREENIVWLVNGLRYEPTITSRNPKHRKFLQAQLLPLGVGRPLLRRFREYYSEWFTSSADRVSDRVSDTHSDRVGAYNDPTPTPTPITKDPTAGRKRRGRARSTSSDDAGFAEFWQRYPKRAGSNPRARAERAWRARRAEKVPVEVMLEGLTRYVRHLEHEGKVGTQFVLQAATFLGPERRYEEPWELPETNGSGGNLVARVRGVLEEQERRDQEDEAWLRRRRGGGA